MYLHEYQSKQTFARYGIPVPAGTPATSPATAAAAAADFGVPVVVNAQTLSHQRVFRTAQSPRDAGDIARDILAMTLSGVRVRTLLIEPVVEVEAEFFLGIYGDRGSDLLLLASTEGGREIGQIERERPATIVREVINPFLGVRDFQARNLASGINLPREHWGAFLLITRSLYTCCVTSDAVRAEINPLALTRDGRLLALGGRLVIDDNALFRQTALEAIHDVKAERESELAARIADITYVPLAGAVGCIVSGAGMGMATVDLLARNGASAASLIDLGSDIHREKIGAALRLTLPNAKVVLFNLFAERSGCDEIAEELAAALEIVPHSVPVVIRLSGQQASEGCARLASAGYPETTALGITDAVQQVVEALRGIPYVDPRQ